MFSTCSYQPRDHHAATVHFILHHAGRGGQVCKEIAKDDRAIAVNHFPLQRRPCKLQTQKGDDSFLSPNLLQHRECLGGHSQSDQDQDQPASTEFHARNPALLLQSWEQNILEYLNILLEAAVP